MATATAIEKDSFVVLQLGGRRFALPAGIVSELAPPVRLNEFPHQTPVVCGVIVRRGRVIPVYDVSPLLLGKHSPAGRFYLVATRRFGSHGELSAIPVDGECELVNAEVLPTPNDSPNYIAGMLALGDDRVEVLDFENLVRADRDKSVAVPIESAREARL
jgi:chemotaxis signal transduction protein